MYYKMKLVASTWLFQGKQRRRMIKLDTLERDTLFHSILTCVYHNYRLKNDINEKYILINRLKMSLMNEEDHFEKIIENDDYNKILEIFSHMFEINIFLFNCKKDESIVENVFRHSTDSPYIMIERCSKFYPLGIKEKNGIHVILYNKFDDEVVRCLNMYEKSGISENYENKLEEEFRVDTSHIFKYDIPEYLTSLKSIMLK